MARRDKSQAPPFGAGPGHPLNFVLLTLAVLFALASPAAAQDAASVTYASTPDVQFATEQGTLQGVALHDGLVLTQSTTRLAAYQDGVLVRVRDTTQDGSYGDHSGDGAVLNGRLYISTSSYPDPLHARHAAVAIYDAASFAYHGEWRPQGTMTGAGGGLGVRHSDDSLWWPFAHRDCETCNVEQVIHELDPTTGAILRTFPLVSASGTYGYQTCDWFPGDLLLCPNHGGKGVDYADLYHYDGTAFSHQAQAPHYAWTSTNATRGTEYGSQGFAVQVDADGSVWTWWAGRNAKGHGEGTGDVVRVSTTVNSPTPPPDPNPPGEDPPPDESNPKDPAGGGGVSLANAAGWSILGAVTAGLAVLIGASQHQGFRARIRGQPVTFAAALVLVIVLAYASLAFVVSTTGGNA